MSVPMLHLHFQHSLYQEPTVSLGELGHFGFSEVIRVASHRLQPLGTSGRFPTLIHSHDPLTGL